MWIYITPRRTWHRLTLYYINLFRITFSIELSLAVHRSVLFPCAQPTSLNFWNISMKIWYARLLRHKNKRYWKWYESARVVRKKSCKKEKLKEWRQPSVCVFMRKVLCLYRLRIYYNYGQVWSNHTEVETREHRLSIRLCGTSDLS